jgi:uncharacterized glyoxalase superfamily protein PhnB
LKRYALIGIIRGREKMSVNAISTCITTEKVAESREFYMGHFNVEVTFDCGWYVNLRFPDSSATLQFMAPREGQSPCNPAGLMYNISVPDVDEEYIRLTGEGLIPVMPLEDHPWGDRGFAVLDPNGVILYLFSERPASDEFKKYFL